MLSIKSFHSEAIHTDRNIASAITQKYNTKYPMPTFPIALIPNRVQRAKSATPTIPPFTAIAPSKPSSPPQPYDINALITYATIGFFVSVIFVFMNPALGAVIGLLSFAAIAYAAWTMKQSFPQRKREHDDYVRRFPKLLQEHMKARSEHTEEMARVNSPENVAKYQQKQLLLSLKQTEPHDGEKSNAQEGFSEAKFYAHLSHYFKGKVHRKLIANIPNYEHPYSPDFTYIEQSLNLYIDIEIDEPYEYRYGQPTHFEGAIKDNRRNQFFLDKNWLVIRFAEEQVVRYPKSCCKAIAQLIAEVVGDSLELGQFAGVEDLPTIRQWTEAEAAQMAANNYRQTYLAGD